MNVREANELNRLLRWATGTRNHSGSRVTGEQATEAARFLAGQAVKALCAGIGPEEVDLSRVLAVNLGVEAAALVFGAARCSGDVSEDEDPEEGPRQCREPSRFTVARSDGDASYGINGGSDEACDRHLADCVLGMLEGDDSLTAIVAVRWDPPEAS